MKRQTFILLISVATVGCLSTHYITHDQTGYDQMNIILIDKKGIITLTNDDVFRGNEINIGTDSTSGVEIERSRGVVTERKQWLIATSDIKKIAIKDHIMGGLIGFGTGFALGAAAGIALTGPLAEWNGDKATTGDYFITAGVAGLMVGITFGLPGLIIGYKDRYVLTRTEEKISDASERCK